MKAGARSKAGLLVARFERLRKNLNIPEDQLARHLGISRSTLYRRKRSGRFDLLESERLQRFSRLLGIARKVFGKTSEVRKWFTSSQIGLDGATPLEYAEIEEGAREVERLLGRIEHTVYS